MNPFDGQRSAGAEPVPAPDGQENRGLTGLHDEREGARPARRWLDALNSVLAPRRRCA